MQHPVLCFFTVAMRVHGAELALGGIDLLVLRAVKDVQPMFLEILEESLDLVDFSGTKEAIDDAVAVAVKLFNLFVADASSGKSGGHDCQGCHQMAGRGMDGIPFLL